MAVGANQHILQNLNRPSSAAFEQNDDKYMYVDPTHSDMLLSRLVHGNNKGWGHPVLKACSQSSLVTMD